MKNNFFLGGLLAAWMIVFVIDAAMNEHAALAAKLVIAALVALTIILLLAYGRAQDTRDLRARLQAAARQIAANQSHAPTSKWVALRKLIVQERRDRSRPGSPAVGWKRGEFAEVLMAKNSAETKEEWGDVGYYVAQSFGVAWALYALVTPRSVISAAAGKFERRAGLEQ
jgi:hypothetical protein